MMNKLIRAFLIIFFIFLNLTTSNALTFSKKEKQYIKNNSVKVAIRNNFYPFTYKEDNKLKGFSYNLLELISKKSNLKIEFVFDSWTNNMSKLRSGEIDIIDSISYTKERSKYINFTNPHFEIPLVLYSKKELNHYDGTLGSLKGNSIGVVKDVFYIKPLEALKNFKIIYFDNVKDRKEAMTSGKVDLTIGNLLNIKKSIIDGKFKEYKILDELRITGLKKEDLRFGVHKNNPILFSIINKTLISLSYDEIDNIKEKWLSIYPKRAKITYEGDIKLTKKEKTYIENKKIIKMCTLNSYAPIEFIDKDGFANGISIDTIRLIEKKLDYKIMIQHVKTKSDEESMLYFEKKLCDLRPISIPNFFNNRQFKYTKVYLDYEAVLITRSDEPFVQSLNDIKYKGIALKDDSNIINHIKKLYPGINIIKTKTHKEAFAKVSSGEVYSTMANLPIASYHITKDGFSNLKIVGHSQNNVKFSMAINSNDENLLSILNKGLNAITQREKATIFNKWANITHNKEMDYSVIKNIVLVALFIIIFLIYRQYMLSKTNEKLQKAKNKLEESNNRIVDILESTVESIIISKGEIIIECNKMAIDLYGYSKKELIGMNIYNLIHSDFHAMVKIKRKSKRTKPYEINIINNDGSIRPTLVRGSDILINGEKHRVSISLDLTELKKTQEALETLNKDLALKVIDEVDKNKKKDLKLLHQARHAQMGELINMIAHQWRQPLNAIAATIMNIQLQLSLDKFDLTNKNESEQFTSFLNVKLENMETFIQTLSVTIDDFRNFYKQDNETKKESVHTPLKKSLNIVKALIISRKIEIIQKFNSEKEIEVYESELLQVFLNIIKNAQDNFEDNQISNPKITISTSDTKNGVIIKIHDNGGGIPLTIIDNIFDPYFSTKDIKNGTGLGLYMSKSIIEKHHKGKFYAHNENNGVCFTIELHDTLDS